MQGKPENREESTEFCLPGPLLMIGGPVSRPSLCPPEKITRIDSSTETMATGRAQGHRER